MHGNLRAPPVKAAYHGGMRRLRRPDHAPRLEMMPLIDVIFLLLTFFIYQMVVMRPVDTLGVELAPVAGGERSVAGRLDVLTIDAAGALFLNNERIAPADLDEQLEAFATDPSEPTLYVTIADAGSTDRGPVLFDLFQRARAAGLTRLSLVGRPGEAGPGGGAPLDQSSPGAGAVSGSLPGAGGTGSSP